MMKFLVILLALLLGHRLANAQEVAIPKVATPRQGAYFSAKLIYPLENRPTLRCHASTIMETSIGLMVAWFDGTREKNADVNI